MEQALKSIAEKINDVHEEPEPGQETNIFKILRLENYEIRHGNFLEYLMDPERNIELAKRFLSEFIFQIIEKLEIEDSGFNRITSGESFEISKIKDESRYTEIPAGKHKKQRIDHALELKVGKTCRVLVFEYKLNGVLQNDLKAYQETIEARYKPSQVHYFILELGAKKHSVLNKEKFRFIPKEAFVEAVKETVNIARQKDMLATKLYLEQYLDIIEPEVESEFSFSGLEKELWESWNPAMDDYEDAYEAYDTLVEDLIKGDDHKGALWGYYYSDVFGRRVKKELEGCTNRLQIKLNQGWLRILPMSRYKDFYFSTKIFEDVREDKIYLLINFRAYQNRKATLEYAKEQKDFMLEVLKNSILKESLGVVQNLESCKEIGVNQDFEVVEEIYHKNDARYPHDFSVHYRRRIDIEALKNICTLEESVEFDLLMKDLIGFIKLIEKAA
jgi:hypothetical protein